VSEATQRTTKSGETITTRETARRSYFVTLTPNMYGRGDIGPARVDVVTYAHTSDTRPHIVDTFRVFVDGVGHWGGPAAHIADDPEYALRGSFAHCVEIKVCDRCGRTIDYVGQCERCRNSALRFATVLANLASMLTGASFIVDRLDGGPEISEWYGGPAQPTQSDPELLALLAEEEEIERRINGR
jgi:hypothetical protein